MIIDTDQKLINCSIVHAIKVAYLFSISLSTCYHRYFLSSVEPLKWCHIHDLYNTDTSLIRTLCSVPSVSVSERLNCTMKSEHVCCRLIIQTIIIMLHDCTIMNFLKMFPLLTLLGASFCLQPITVHLMFTLIWITCSFVITGNCCLWYWACWKYSEGTTHSTQC